MHSIEIDFEVFKEITIRRSSEDVTPNDVIRNLLGLPKAQFLEEKIETKNERLAWTTKGVVFPHGTAFRAIYKGQTFNATVEDGVLVVNGQKFSSPSSAAVSITGNPVHGWIFWECKMPGKQTWETIKKYRRNKDKALTRRCT